MTAFANSTGTPTKNNTGPISSNCCFVVQDNVNEYWWQAYTTPPPVYSVVNVTSITTLVTPYTNGTVTNYETNVHTTNASFTRSFPVGYNPASLLVNDAPQPVETITSLNGTQIVTAGATLSVLNFFLHAKCLLRIYRKSPAAFWVYSKLKVITVPAVTNSNGDAVCVTTSTAQSVRVETQTPFTLTDTTISGYTTTYAYNFSASTSFILSTFPFVRW